MKLYNNIYIPDSDGEFRLEAFYEDHHEWVQANEGAVTEKNNVIVLSIEELREVYDLGIKEILRYITHEGWIYAKASGIENLYVRQSYLKDKINKLLEPDDGFAWNYNFNTYLQSKGISI